MTTLVLVALLIPILLIVGVGSVIYLLIRNKTTSMEPKTKALDVFVYLGIFISLIVSVVYIIQTLFAAIERKFTDVLEAGQYVDAYGSDMRLAIASLIVAFPIYLLLSMYVSRDIKKFLYKRDIFVRKIFIYTTLFVTALTLLGSLITTIYYYLGGELTIRFGLKALAVFVIAGAVCGYYMYSLRRDYAKETKLPTVFAVISSLLVLVSLVWSITIIGTPSELRAKRIDSTRLSDISSIQQQVFNRFQTTDKLPLTLAELNDAFQGYAVPVDPVTKAEYKYTVLQQPVVKVNYATNKKEMTTNAVFQICATFDTARNVNGQAGVNYPKAAPSVLSTDSPYSVSNYYYEGDQSPFWNHGVGETCFKRIITPDMYYGGR
jgi:hypothetical protein